MKKLIWFLIFIYLTGRMSLSVPVYASETAGNSAVLVEMTSLPTVDIRPRQLEEFLNYYNSPLAAYSGYLVQMADKYVIDWKLLPAIAGVESTFGKNIPYGSYNAYGWDEGNAHFRSWEESIEEVSKGLGEKYYKRDLDTLYEIAPVYCPPSKVWVRNVTYFIKKLDEFEKKAWLKIVPLMI